MVEYENSELSLKQHTLASRAAKHLFFKKTNRGCSIKKQVTYTQIPSLVINVEWIYCQSIILYCGCVYAFFQGSGRQWRRKRSPETIQRRQRQQMDVM